jgi:hypothetical protein
VRCVSDQEGYKTLKLGGSHGPTEQLHRLVAKTFHPNDQPERNQVNHKDKDRGNAHVSNLEWVTAAENVEHAYYSNSKKRVLQVDKDGRLIREWSSQAAAARELGVLHGNISAVLKGARRHTGGYYFVYKE